MVEEIDLSKLKISEKDTTMLHLDLLEWLDTHWDGKLSYAMLTQYQSIEISKETVQKLDNFIRHKIPAVSREMKNSHSKDKLRAMLLWYHQNIEQLMRI